MYFYRSIKRILSKIPFTPYFIRLKICFDNLDEFHKNYKYNSDF